MEHRATIFGTGALVSLAMLSASALRAETELSAAAAREGVSPSAELREVMVLAPRLMEPMRVWSPPAQARSSNLDNPRLEEVTIQGKKTLAAYRVELRAARQRVWDVFNEVNSDDAFDIQCTEERKTGTLIKRRVCRPAFDGATSSQAAKEYATSFFSVCERGMDQDCIFSEKAQLGMTKSQAIESQLFYKHDQLADEMRRLALENLQLRQAMLEYQALERAYNEARERQDED